MIAANDNLYIMFIGVIVAGIIYGIRTSNE